MFLIVIHKPSSESIANTLISLGKEPDNSEIKVEQSMLKNIEKAIPGPVLNPPKNFCLKSILPGIFSHLNQLIYKLTNTKILSHAIYIILSFDCSVYSSLLLYPVAS